MPRCAGGSLRMLTVLDENTRECHVLRADRALTSGDVIKLVQAATIRLQGEVFRMRKIRRKTGAGYRARH